MDQIGKLCVHVPSRVCNWFLTVSILKQSIIFTFIGSCLYVYYIPLALSYISGKLQSWTKSVKNVALSYQPQGQIQDFFLGGGALVSCSTSTPINHIVFFFFFTEYQLYQKTTGHLRGEVGVHPLHPPPRSTPEPWIWRHHGTSSRPTLVSVVQSGSEMIQPHFNNVFVGGKGGVFVVARAFESFIS